MKNVLDRYLMTKVRKPKRNGEAQVNVERIIRKAGSFSGLVISLKKILNIERQKKACIELYYNTDGI